VYSSNLLEALDTEVQIWI